MKCGNTLDWICGILLIIGGINWGLVGLFHFNLVHTIFGSLGMVERIVYDIVGLCAIYVLVRLFTGCKGKK